ncbi:AAA family ATPase [Geomesophilobacter sediminis]|uniref:AAA family ATPase n=1 Tax=Geomesophilobacter sediminis TaxID=2798584 RepID=A0A8J7LTZ9_9BACT|nr:AAA family ATPase [Geomesophilobacter sediminis]MBJ6723989.1 AAA family ATPase [Geomesophilobacter sediminis]
MAKKIFIAATGQNCGKTTMSISLMHLARKKYQRVGFIKPFGPKTVMHDDFLVDMDALLMAKAFGLEEDIALMSPVSLHRDFTKDYLMGRLDDLSLANCIKDAVRELEEKYDFLVIEGAGHGGVGAVIGLSNAKVAKLIDAPVLIVTESGIGKVIDSVHLNLALYEREGADVRGIIANKLIPSKKEITKSFLQRSLEPIGLKVIDGFNYSPTLANPTLAHISKLFNLPLQGDLNEKSRIIHNIQLGAASSQKVIDGLMDSTLLILTSSRDELIVTLSSLYHIPAYRDKIAGLVVAGHVAVSEISQQILHDSNIPYIRVEETTAKVFTTLMEDVAKITYEDQEKLNWITANAEVMDFEAIDALL